MSATREIRPLLKDIEAKLPSGYRIDVGGAVEESGCRQPRADGSLPGDARHDPDDPDAAAQSFSLMFMVFLTAPLGLIGVVAALLVFQAPLASSRSSASPRCAG